MRTKLDDAQKAVLSDLQEAINNAEDDGVLVPCRGRLEWTVEGDAERLEYAANRCRLCPAFHECQRAAAALQPTAGVWAGRIFFDRSHR